MLFAELKAAKSDRGLSHDNITSSVQDLKTYPRTGGKSTPETTFEEISLRPTGKGGAAQEPEKSGY